MREKIKKKKNNVFKTSSEQFKVSKKTRKSWSMRTAPTPR